MGVTIYDIAKQADVSIATVSRVFNNSPRVSARTRERVMEIARRLNYQPNVSAQSLARQKTHLISAVVPVMTNYFYMEVMRGMQDALAESEYDLIVYVSPKPEEVDSQLERATQKGRSEGMILMSMPLTEARTKRLKASKQPVLLVDALHPDFDSISVDNAKGGYMGTKHLIELGYERVGHITVSPEPPPAEQRRVGYEKALREAGLAVNPALVARSPRQPFGFVEEAGYEAMQLLLARPVRPDAVFVASDMQALGALRALRDAGLRVPEDMAMVGFDDIEICAYVGLTTLRQPMYEMGKLAVEKLLTRIRHPDHPITQTVFSPRLIQRTTTRARGDLSPVTSADDSDGEHYSVGESGGRSQ